MPEHKGSQNNRGSIYPIINGSSTDSRTSNHGGENVPLGNDSIDGKVATGDCRSGDDRKQKAHVSVIPDILGELFFKEDRLYVETRQTIYREK